MSAATISPDRQRAESYIRENRWLPASEWAHPNAKRPAPATVLPGYLRKRKIRGLPVKWRPMYDELARRMYHHEPGAMDFSYESDRGVFIVRPFDFVGPRDKGWLEFHDPNDLAAYLGIADALAARKRARRTTSKPKQTSTKAVSEVAATTTTDVFATCAGCGDEVPAQGPAVRADGKTYHVACATVYGLVGVGAPAAAPAGELPAWATEYLGRLVYAAKRDYAEAWLRHVLHGAPEPADPGRDWARKVRDRVERLRKLNG